MRKTPIEMVYADSNFGIRPGTNKKVRKMTPEEEEEELKALDEDLAATFSSSL